MCHEALEVLCQLTASRTQLLRREDKGKVEDVKRFLKDMGVRESLRRKMVAILAKSSKISRRIFLKPCILCKEEYSKLKA